MENKQQRINLDPIHIFLTEDIRPKDFAKLLDELMYNYVLMFLQTHENDRIGIHENATEFIYYLKLLRDILPRMREGTVDEIEISLWIIAIQRLFYLSRQREIIFSKLNKL